MIHDPHSETECARRIHHLLAERSYERTPEEIERIVLKFADVEMLPPKKLKRMYCEFYDALRFGHKNFRLERYL